MNPQTVNKDTTVVELTSKKWKKKQLIGILCLSATMILCTLCTLLYAAYPIFPIASMYVVWASFGYAMFASIVYLIIIGVLIWWHHG